MDGGGQIVHSVSSFPPWQPEQGWGEATWACSWCRTAWLASPCARVSTAGEGLCHPIKATPAPSPVLPWRGAWTEGKSFRTYHPPQTVRYRLAGNHWRHAPQTRVSSGLTLPVSREQLYSHPAPPSVAPGFWNRKLPREIWRRQDPPLLPSRCLAG